jgi:hypothetical protein
VTIILKKYPNFGNVAKTIAKISKIKSKIESFNIQVLLIEC